MGGLASRRKGAAGERAVAKELQRIWPEAKRGLGQARSGHEVSDVDGCPYRIECKIGKRPDILGAVRQAKDDAAKSGDKRPIMVVSKRDREGWLVTVELSEMTRLLELVSAVTDKTGWIIMSGPK